MVENATVATPDLALKARVRAGFGLVVAGTPLIAVPATTKEPVGATVSLTTTSTVVSGLPATSVSVTERVTFPSLNAEAVIPGTHEPLGVMVLLPVCVCTPSVIENLAAAPTSPVTVATQEPAFALLM